MGAWPLRVLRFAFLLSLWILASPQVMAQFTFVTNNGAITITGYTGTNGIVTIPSSTNGKPVTVIYQAAFQNNTNLGNVTIPASVTNAGPDAFFGCAGLSNLSVLGTNITFGANAFGQCSKLSFVTVSGTFSNFATVFSPCIRLTNAAILSGSQTVAPALFSNCAILTAISIPNSVTNIGSNAFYACGALTGITIPPSVETVGASAFQSCLHLLQAVFLGNAPSVDPSAFAGSYNTTIVYLPDTTGWGSTLAGVNTIAAGSLNGFYYLTNSSTISIIGCVNTNNYITIPASINGIAVATIAEDAFEGLTNLDGIFIEASISSIQDYAFTGDSNLTALYFEGASPIVSASAFAAAGNAVAFYIPSSGSAWNSTLGGIPAESVTPPSQFSYVQSGTGTCTIQSYNGTNSAVVIPAFENGLLVESLAPEAISPKSFVTSVTIPGSMTNIGASAFYNCTGITNISLPQSVTTVGNGAFRSCTGLISAYLPASVTNLSFDVFSGCYKLTNLTAPGSVMALDNYLSPLTNLAQLSVAPGSPFIAPLEFEYLTSLKTVVIPASVTNIGMDAFSECYALSNITIPGTVVSIGEHAFAGDFRLTNINIGNGVVNIGSGAFSEANVTNVFIPASVTNLAGAFSGLPELRSFTVDSSNLYFSASNGILFDKLQTALIQYPGYRAGTYAIPTSVTSIDSNAFGFCPSLYGITIPPTVTNIGASAFVDDVRLTAVAIPESVTTIGAEAFYDSALTNVFIPDSVTNIGAGAFADCANLTSITVDPSNLFYASSNGVMFDKNFDTLIQFPGGWPGSYTVPASVTNVADDAFAGAMNLTNLFFPGNAPSADGSVFYSCLNLTVYYLPEASGWTNFSTEADVPAVAWNPVIAMDSSFGISNGQFGFNITAGANIPVVVEACSNLTTAAWAPLQSLSLTNGSAYFSDSLQNGSASRFYRLSTP